MEFFRIRRDIRFMRFARFFNLISALTFVVAVALLTARGLHLSIEFTGGTSLEVNFPQAVELEKIKAALPESLRSAEPQLQLFGTPRDVLIQMRLHEKESSAQQAQSMMEALRKIDAGAQLRRAEYTGAQVGSELARDGAIALLFVIVGITLYLAMRFEWKFALAGILANLHDVVIILGLFALFQWEFSLTVLAAILAVLGYSVNESVIIFDRVRETFRNQRRMTPREVMDHSITGTMSRTIITHGLTQTMVVTMLLFGGAALHYFALALTIGILFGIYSSVFVAAGLALWFGVKREDLLSHAKPSTLNRDDPNAGAVV